MIASLRDMALKATDEREARALASRIAQITRTYRIRYGIGIPSDPVKQAAEIDPGYRTRPHLDYLGERIAQAVHDVERGQNRMLAVSMPPRAGKSTTLSLHTPLWLLRRHPEWKIVMASHDGGLTASWARAGRRLIESKPDLGIALQRDGGAGARWNTVEQGGMFTTSVRGALTGRGARVMIIDDPVKDFVDAHSTTMRQAIWDWWLSVALTRLEPPYLVIVVMTRWHEDDMIGRLLSDEWEGDPAQWEKISLSALADTEDDVLGRQEGEPLISPLLNETPEQAIERWSDVRNAVGTYTFSAMYQQRPAPAKGAIFDSGWWRFWTMDERRATEDGRCVYLDPSSLTGGRWLDSWDMAFKSTSPGTGGWVVGQRWVRNGANRYLIAQDRGRYPFTASIAAMERWAITDDPAISPCGHLVHERLVEEKANGAAIIDVLKDKISGIKPVNPTTSKEARARAITPEIESGNVYLPHPADPGNEWVTDLLSELRNFPYDAHDDQVDALTQALSNLRDTGRGQVTVPGRPAPTGGRWQINRNIGQAAVSDANRRRTR
jgi:predicted phage terminase large subunit-like protein